MEPTGDNVTNIVELKKSLEWELSLDSRDLRSHAWYHGAIPRAQAEDIVVEEGGFLVRDCTSQPGNFVLTCRTKTQPLHFVINKIILQPDTVYERVQYQFEEDAFDTVPDLITFYVGSGKPITVASNARIQFPKNRMYPLFFYASRYSSPLAQSCMTSPTGNMQFRYHPLQCYKALGSPNHHTKDTPKLPSKKYRSQSLTPSGINRTTHEKCYSADGVIQYPSVARLASADGVSGAPKYSTHSLPRSPYSRLSLSVSSNTLCRHSRVISDPALSPDPERKVINAYESSSCDFPPAKPSRVPSLIKADANGIESCDETCDGVFLTRDGLQRLTSCQVSGSDSGNGSGDSALSSAATEAVEAHPRSAGVIIKNPRYHGQPSMSSALKIVESNYGEMEENILNKPHPEIGVSINFDLENFQTLLLPVNENKPLDMQVLRTIKMILKDTGSRILANHLTSADLDIILKKKYNDNLKDFRLINGIELCTLPQGQQLRRDLIERTECLKLLVAVTILTCGDVAERTETLNKWIEVAIDTKSALGNLFGFCGIMSGLCLPQIEKLTSTWHNLRQKFTDTAFNFEAKLRPTLKNMNMCLNPQAPNTTIPHLLPLILLLERNLDDFLSHASYKQEVPNALGLWETNTEDFGLSNLLAHLNTARVYTNSSAAYQRNAEIVLGEAKIDELTVDMFKTEFHLKFLWGSRGAFAAPFERHSKFEQVMTAMTEKYVNQSKEIEM